MMRSSISYCALLFVFCVFTNAAPPLNSLSSALLDLINTTALSPALRNLTIPNGLTRMYNDLPFPPGPEPPENFFSYDVPFSNPLVNLKFHSYIIMSECNETDVDRCLQKAMLACGDRGKHFTAMTDGETYEWENGQVFLRVLPEKSYPEQEQVLTYGIFTDVLQGINNFRLFYTHLSFWYDIYVYPGEEGYKTYVGEGQLNE